MNDYPQYPTRKILHLDGCWEFHLEEHGDWQKIPPGRQYDDLMTVPGAFDCTPRYYCKRGTAFYRRFFTLAEACPEALLKLGGIGLRGRFLIDGHEIGRTALAYSGVEFVTGALTAGTHEIVAIIDNQFEENHAQLFYPYYDFYAFGGFYRSVELQPLSCEYRIDRVQVRTVDYRRGKVRLNCRFGGTVPEKLSIRLRFDTDSAPKTIVLTPRDNQAAIEATVPHFKLWSPATPNLHTVMVQTATDAVVEQFGIREIKTAGRELQLNGRPLYLKGFNRHESHPQFGPASPEQLLIEDLQNLKALNCNFVRGCHYPQDQRFLELCDRMGILVWEESLGWGNGPEQFADPEFVRQNEAQTRLMVQNSINHPAVIIWAFLNEFASHTPEGRELCRRLVDAIREEDDSRPVTFACCHCTDDICADLLDLVAINVYPGWIGPGTLAQPPTLIKPGLDNVTAYFRQHGAAEKPLLVSEMGTCAIYGQHDRAAAQWTEEFQAEYLAEVIDRVFESPEFCGLTIWQLNDAKSYLRIGAEIRTKPTAFNLAGVFDPYRRPKLAADIVKARFAVQ